MKDQTYSELISALDLLATGKCKRTNGKITAVNFAKEANISKATLYRYFNSHPKLQEEFESFRRKGVISELVPKSIHDENKLLKLEIKSLKSIISELKSNHLQLNNIKAHNIMMLSKEIEILQLENKTLSKQLAGINNISYIQKI